MADAMQIAPEFPSKRKRRVFFDEAPDDASPSEQHDEDESEEVAFKRDIFFVIIDSVVAGVTNRYEVVNSIDTHIFSYPKKLPKRVKKSSVLRAWN